MAGVLPDEGARQPAEDVAVSGGGFLRRWGCPRRQSPEALEKAQLQRYREMTLAGRGVPQKRKEWYEKLAWWSDCKTKQGGRIFVLVPRGPKGEHDVWIHMWELLQFATSKMHGHVVTENKPFAVVWVQFGDHRIWLPTINKFQNSLHPNYAKNLEAVHVVHPSWGVRVLRLVLWPIAPDDFWDRFHAHERVEFLETFVSLQKFTLPKDVYDYDKWLDKQALEMSEQAKDRMFGGMGGGSGAMSEEEQRKHQQQMEEFKRLLAEKGLDKRD